jgi:DNA mismatch repair protein MutL
MADFFQSHAHAAQQDLGFAGHKTTTYPPAAGNDRSTPSRKAATTVTDSLPEAEPAPPRKFLQLHDTYIVVEVEDGFMIVDQHALHERIIYEELCSRLGEGPLESQKLLIPESFEVTSEQADALEAHADMLEKLGISVEPFGPRTMAVQAFPVILEKVRPAEFVQGFLDLAADSRLGVDQERLLHELLDMAACKAAVKAGQKLSEGEIAQLLADRERVERSSRCPHGRPTVIKLSLSELEKQFRRT